MHAVWGWAALPGAGRRAVHLQLLDAPVVALGEKLPVYFTREQPDLAQGFHFSLFNNGWAPTTSSGSADRRASGSGIRT